MSKSSDMKDNILAAGMYAAFRVFYTYLIIYVYSVYTPKSLNFKCYTHDVS